jgi:hypothetical protein
MADIKIVCDASYDESLRFTGYAGGIYATEGQHVTSTYMYNGVAGEHRHIQDGEFEAVLVGLNELSRYEKLGNVQVNSLEIYSDSKNSIAILSHWENPHYVSADPRLDAQLHIVRKICQEREWHPTFKHVKAHTSHSKASGIERLNNIADKNASIIRRNTLHKMLHPNFSKHENVAVIVPPEDDLTHGEAEAFYALAHALVAQHKKIRLYSPHCSYDHPFCLGAIDACMKLGINSSSVLHLSTYNAQGMRMGLNMTLYRYHMKEKGLPSHLALNGTPGEARAAQACELLYGLLSPSHMGNRTPSKLAGRLYNPSYVVYDLMSPLSDNAYPQTVQGWMLAFLEHVDIQHVKGVLASYEHANVPTHKISCLPREVQARSTAAISTITKASDPSRDALHETFDIYHDAFEKNQFMVKIMDTLHEIGFPNNGAFNTAMNRFLNTCPTHKPDVFINRTLRQATKLSTARPALPTAINVNTTPTLTIENTPPHYTKKI